MISFAAAGISRRFMGLGFAAWLAVGVAAPASAQPSPDWIRVAINKNIHEVTLQIFGRYSIVALHTGTEIHQGPRLLSVPVRGVPEGLALGEQVLPYFGVRITPARDAAISLNGKRLRGALEIVRQKDLSLLVINYVALEDYLRGVLSKEVPNYWPPEAMKAVAIAARTYAIFQRLTKAVGDYDVTGDVMSQDYGGKASEKVETTRAVKATSGLIVTYQGQVFPTFYHSTCGGMTENGRVMGPFDIRPLSGGVRCTFCSPSPFYAWQRRLTRADVNWALRKSRHGTVGPVDRIMVTRRTPSGRAEEILIVGSQRLVRLSGYDFRALFGFDSIRSPLFTVLDAGDAFVLDGHGWGHGVGLCQFGAAELARRGFSAGEILAYYYPQIELVSLRELATQPIRVIGGGS